MKGQGPQGQVTSDTLLQIIGVKEVEIFVLKQQLGQIQQSPDDPALDPTAPVDIESNLQPKEF